VSAVDRAVPGDRPAPTTATAPSDGPSPSPAGPAPASAGPAQTFTSAGGTIRAACTASGLAQLLSWSPIRPYRVGRVDPGPASTAVAAFTRGKQTIDMTVACRGTTATVTTSTHAT
jgi:serine/threonine-protein kinase